MPEFAPVSAVVPCWRCVDTIGRAVASIAAQTWRPAEVILVDDASGDETLDHLHTLASEYPEGWVRVIGLAANGGPGIARNAGWEAATQPYIALLDADDAWHPCKTEMQLGWMVAHPMVALTGTGTLQLADDAPLPAVSTLLPPRPVDLAGMLVSNRFLTRTAVFRRDLEFRFHGREVTEDYLLWLQIVAAGLPAMRFDEPLAFSFRPEYSAGGYSGQLWRHERRELAALAVLRREGTLSSPVFALASGWSLLKYGRRVWRNWRGRF